MTLAKHKMTHRYIGNHLNQRKNDLCKVLRNVGQGTHEKAIIVFEDGLCVSTTPRNVEPITRQITLFGEPECTATSAE